MKNRFFAFFLVFVLVFCLASCDKNNEDTSSSASVAETSVTSQDTSDDTSSAQSTSTPILYKVTDSDGSVLWLFGSVHAGNDSFYPLPDYVTDAYNSSDALAVEVDILAFEADTQMQINALAPLVYSDGTTIKDHIPQELYDKAVKIFEDNQAYSAALDYYCASMWASLIDNITYTQMDLGINLGVDRHMLNKAKKDGKKITEIESAEEQYAMMGDFSEELQIYLLEASVNTIDELEAASDMMNEILSAWEKGDEELLQEILFQDIVVDESQQEIAEEYTKAMTADRNNKMTEFAVDALASDEDVFVCVGIAHILGEGGMADQLAKKGYTVEKIG